MLLHINGINTKIHGKASTKCPLMSRKSYQVNHKTKAIDFTITVFTHMRLYWVFSTFSKYKEEFKEWKLCLWLNIHWRIKEDADLGNKTKKETAKLKIFERDM